MQTLFDFIKRHVQYFGLGNFILALIASYGQFNDTTGIYHVIGWATLSVFVLLVLAVFRGKDMPN